MTTPSPSPLLKNLMRAFDMDPNEAQSAFGAPGRAALEEWTRETNLKRLPPLVQVRVSILVAILQKARALPSVRRKGLATWMRSPNTAPGFHRRSPYQLITSGDLGDLRFLRGYLDFASSADDPEGDADVDPASAATFTTVRADGVLRTETV